MTKFLNVILINVIYIHGTSHQAALIRSSAANESQRRPLAVSGAHSWVNGSAVMW
jgi:hypothetical protein